MTITLILAKAFLLKLRKRDLRWQHLDLDAEELIALLNDILDNLMMIQSHKQMQATVTAIGQNDATFDVLDACNRKQLFPQTDSAFAPPQYTFNITYDPVNVLVVVARKDRVGCRIELIQRAGSHLERNWELYAGPVVLSRIKLLHVTWAFGKVFVEFQERREHVVLEFRGKSNRVYFLFLL